jgi:hypothetical protein
MSVEGFANSYEVMQKAMHGLIEAGAVRRTTPAERGADAAPAAAIAAGAKANGNGASLDHSPNFA